MKHIQMLGDHPLHLLGQCGSEKFGRDELAGKQHLGRAVGANASPNLGGIVHRCDHPTILHVLQRLAQGGDADSMVVSFRCHSGKTE